MPEHNILITGTPRSGTTLTCHLLNKLPQTVALHEPMRGADFQPPEEVAASVERFCESQRRSILDRGLAISKHEDGVVPANPVGTGRSESGLRKRLVAKGEIVIDKDVTPDFVLAVKHCGAFTAALDRLVGSFPVYAVVRNPLATLASWTTVEFAVRQGHVPNAERMDPDLRARLASFDDDLERQISLLDWFHERIRRYLPDEAIIRYESIVESGGKALAVAHPSAATLSEPLQSQNTSGLYDHDGMHRLGERLLRSDGAYWQSYTRESVERILRELTAATGSLAGAERGST
jgi:hypothetical protein